MGECRVMVCACHRGATIFHPGCQHDGLGENRGRASPEFEDFTDPADIRDAHIFDFNWVAFHMGTHLLDQLSP